MQTGNILIIGGAGFIGVNAARYFSKKGWEVTIFDNFSRKGTELNAGKLIEDYPNIKVVRGDIRNEGGILQEEMEKNDAVLHLAAQVAVTTSVKNPREDFEINALGTFNVLEAIRTSTKKPILLYTSTNKVYGGLEDFEVQEQETRYWFKDDIKGVNEEVPLDFHSPYGCSKGAADQYVRDYARIYGLKTVVFRQSCIYGPHQFGIEDQGWVAWFLIAGMLGRDITIYGTGKQVRDILFVEDLVDLYYRSINNIDNISGKVFNVGGGAENSISLLEFLQIIKEECDLHMPHTFSDWRPGDQPIFVSDNTLSGQEVGWKTTTTAREGIKKLYTWLVENKEDIKQFYV